MTLRFSTKRAWCANEALMDMLMIEVLARGVAIGALAALGAGLWTGGAGQPVRLAGVLFCIGVIAYTINSSPQLRHAAGGILPLFHFFALGGTGLFWLFIVALFEDRPVSALTLAPAFLMTAIGVIGIATTGALQQGVWVFHNVVEAAFSGHALYVIVRSWRGDLVEARRRLRGPFLAVVTLYVITLSGFEIAEILGQDAPWHRLLGGVSLAVYCLAGAIVFLQARTELFGAARPARAPAVGLDAGERATLDRLGGLMEAGAWRREGLTIGELAEQAGVPEHRLRPADQRPPRLPQLRRLRERPPHRGRQGLARGPSAGASISGYDRVRPRLRFARAVQPRLQGRRRPDANAMAAPGALAESGKPWLIPETNSLFRPRRELFALP